MNEYRPGRAPEIEPKVETFEVNQETIKTLLNEYFAEHPEEEEQFGPVTEEVLTKLEDAIRSAIQESGLYPGDPSGESIKEVVRDAIEKHVKEYRQERSPDATF